MSTKKIPPDLLIVLLWTTFTFIFTIVPGLNNTILKSILGIVTVLFIPGYVLMAVLFPKKILGNVERIGLSLGSSIIIVPLLGLILNFTFGIGPIPVLIALCLYIVVMILATVYRRYKLTDEERFSVDMHGVYETVNNGLFRSKNRKDIILTIILIFSIIFAIGMMYFAITAPKIGERFTEFYILNSSGKTQYQKDLEYNTPTTFIIGVTNHEYTGADYNIQTVLDKDVLNTEKITLKHNETWKKDIIFSPNKKGNDLKLEFLLFKENNTVNTGNNTVNTGNNTGNTGNTGNSTEPYRRLYLWVNVSNGK